MKKTLRLILPINVLLALVTFVLLTGCVVYPDGAVAPAPGVGVGLADAGVAAADIGLAAATAPVGYWGGGRRGYYHYDRPYYHGWHKGGYYSGYRRWR
jgi:hypothetical protein